MKILVLIHEYPPIGGGGGQAAQDICEGLVKHGHKVQVITSHYAHLPYHSEINGVHVNRIKVHRAEAYKAGFSSMFLYVWGAIIEGLKIIREWHPEVIHTHFAVPAGAVSFVISLFTGVPYILTTHLGDVPGGVPDKTSKWFRWIFPFTPPIWKKAKQIIAVSEFTRQLALKHYPVEIEVIPNGVDLNVLDPGEIQKNDPPQIVFAGRIVTQKNPQLFVETLVAIRDLPWKAVIIGDGALMDEISKKISDNGLGERITFTGWIKPDEVIDWYKKSDILFMPSRSEGLPLVGVQALSMGLALVLSDVGGNNELISIGDNGFIYSSSDNNGFEEGLRKLLSDPERLLKFRQSSRNLAAKLDIFTVVKSYEAIFHRYGHNY